MYRAGIPTESRGNFHYYSGFKISLESCKSAVETGKIQMAIGRCNGGNADLYGGGQPDNIPLYSGTSCEDVNRYIITNQIEMLSKIKKDDRLSRDIVTLPGMCQFRTIRRIEGEYVLKESDAYHHFDDSIGAINDFDRRDFLYEIPYRSLISSKTENMITCGRLAAGDGYAWDVLRVIPPAIISGQAAGMACAHAIDEGVCICNVNIKYLQGQLESANVKIHFDDADIPDESDTTVEHND